MSITKRSVPENKYAGRESALLTKSQLGMRVNPQWNFSRSSKDLQRNGSALYDADCLPMLQQNEIKKTEDPRPLTPSTIGANNFWKFVIFPRTLGYFPS
jgi:hypothetical protein